MSGLKTIGLGVAVLGAVLLGGCTSRYDDSTGTYYSSDGYRYHHDRDGTRWDRHDRDGDATNRDDWHDAKKVRVCDADGDDCHWEYRQR